MNRLRPARLVALLCSLAMTPLASASYAQTNIALSGMRADPTAPVEVTAESLNINQSTQTAIFTGNVLIKQGDIRIGAGTAEVSYDSTSGQISRLQLEGGVTLTTPNEAAESTSAIYEISTADLTLLGDVLLTQGTMILAADRMRADLRAGTAQMDGNVRTSLSTGQ